MRVHVPQIVIQDPNRFAPHNVRVFLYLKLSLSYNLFMDPEFALNLAKEKIKTPLLETKKLDFRLAKYDESRAAFRREVEKSNFKVLDVGPGFNPPVLSIDQKDGDLWIGVDPALDYEVDTKTQRGERLVEMGASRILVPGEADVMPAFKADLIMIVAPNPKDIVEGGLLDQIEKYLGKGTMVYLKLDNRTMESAIYGKSAKAKIIDFFRQHGFISDELNDLNGRMIDTSTSKDAVGGSVFKAKKIR